MKDIIIPAKEEWYEICQAYKNRKQGRGKDCEMIKIQSELHACSTDAIKYILIKNGEKVGGQRSAWLKEKLDAEGIEPMDIENKIDEAAKKQQAVKEVDEEKTKRMAEDVRKAPVQVIEAQTTQQIEAAEKQQATIEQEATTQQETITQQQAAESRPIYSMKIPTASVLSAVGDKMSEVSKQINEISNTLKELNDHIEAMTRNKVEKEREYAELKEFFNANAKYL